MPSIAAERALAGREMLPLRGTLAAPLPPHVRDAVAAALDEHAVTPPSRGHLALREAIARSLPAPADPERELLVTNGAMQALGLTFRALLERGGRGDRADAVLLLRRPDRARRRRLRPGPELGPGRDRARRDPALARPRPDEPEQPRRPPADREPRSTSCSPSPPATT